jgi:hypothetical protein
MPALRVLGQPMLFAGDDLRVVAIGSILLRLLQIALLVPAFVYVVRLDEPPDDYVLEFSRSISKHGRELVITYWSLASFTALASICLEAFM